jgi:hypothetical protein
MMAFSAQLAEGHQRELNIFVFYTNTPDAHNRETKHPKELSAEQFEVLIASRNNVRDQDLS